jgi:bacterioferritin
MTDTTITREQLIDALNADLSREYQAIIAYVNYSQMLNGAEYMNISDVLEKHAAEELSHALKIAYAVSYLGGMPSVVPVPVKTSTDNKAMLSFDLANEQETIRQYRRRSLQARELHEVAICTMLDGLLEDEQDHLVKLATALGITPPDCGIAGPEAGAWS